MGKKEEIKGIRKIFQVIIMEAQHFKVWQVSQQ